MRTHYQTDRKSPLETSHPFGAFTLVELLVVIAIIGVLIALLLPAVQAAREAARRMQCSNHSKQLALAVHNFHDTNMRFPAAANDVKVVGKVRRGNFIFLVMPFMEQTSLYDFYLSTNKDSWTGDNGNVVRPISALLCPSDAESTGWNAGYESGSIYSNYCGSLADIPTYVEIASGNIKRMAPHLRSWLEEGVRETTFATISDGTSNSILGSEHLICDAKDSTGSDKIGGDYRRRIARCNGDAGSAYWGPPDSCLSKKGSAGQYLSSTEIVRIGGHNQGLRAFDAAAQIAIFHTLLPPNSPSCTQHNNDNNAMMSASSGHPGGVNVSLLDGSVRFVSETIQVTNLNRYTLRNPNSAAGPYDNPPPAPSDSSGTFGYGVWSELGSVNGGETASLP